MKINMWKLLIVALIASTALVGCKDERDNFMVDDTISFINTGIMQPYRYTTKSTTSP